MATFSTFRERRGEPAHQQREPELRLEVEVERSEVSPAGNPEFGTVMKVIRALGLELRGATAKR